MTSQTICDDVKQSICWPVQKMYFGAGFSVFSPNMWKCRQPVLDVLSVKLEREQLLKKSIFGRTKKIWRLHCWLQTFSGHWKQEAINKKIFQLIRQVSCDCSCSRPAVGDPLTEIQQKWYTAYRLIQTQFQGQLLCLWNGLPDDVVTAPSVNAFKNRLDHLWRNLPTLYAPTCQNR